MQSACGRRVFAGLTVAPARFSASTPGRSSARSLKSATSSAMFPYASARARPPPPPVSTLSCPCRLCTSKRRLLFGASTALLPVLTTVFASAGPPSDPISTLEKVHPPRPDWYQELYAWALEKGTKRYEAEVSVYKEKLFAELTAQSKQVLELGVGTGPNFKYYANAVDRFVTGVDPLKQMEKYARASAEAAGLQSTNFRFINGVGEALDVKDNSMDVVIGTLVLCSVYDVAATLKEVKRVLKPGGLYLFIEHVAAPDGSYLRFFQGILDPLQQFLADGCHTARETGKQISEAGFSSVNLQMVNLSSAFLLSPHVYGVACK